jgi:hypothetical protein
MYWNDRTESNYFDIIKDQEYFCPMLNKINFIKSVRSSSKLSEYHKKQMTRAIKKGFGTTIEPYWKDFNSKKIDSEKLITNVNNTLINSEIDSDKLFFSSTDDFLGHF